MRERAREIGATLSLRATPGVGTEVRLRFDPGADL
jgi:nitrate/nitrite-specific signal transduction histidine kinase